MTGYSRAVKGLLSPLLQRNNQESSINNQENPKYEYRNPKQIRNTKYQNPKLPSLYSLPLRWERSEMKEILESGFPHSWE
jgi:hypothetical protein